jgi:Tol biopolymer transport system component
MQKYTIAGIVAVALAITCMGAYVLSLDLSAVSGRSHSLPPESMSPHPFTVEDLVTLQKVRSPSPSPDGAWIVFPLRSNALVAGRELMNLWIVGSDGSNPRQLTFQPGDDSNLVWSSDGSAIYYLSTRSGSSQVWKVSPSGQDAVQITDFPLDVAHLKISPDGTSLAFSMAVFPGTNSTATAGRVARIAGQNASGQIYDRLPIRHWDAWEDGRRNHIFVMPLSTHVPVDVMQAMDADSPTKPFGSAGEYTFTPDSTGIIFSAADTGRAEAWSTGHNLYLSPASGMGAIINLTQENHAWAVDDPPWL